MKLIVSKLLIIAAIIAVVFVVDSVWVWVKLSSKPVTIGCTMDAKICPDGSAVGRVAPTCEFAACPEQKPLEITIYCASNKCQPQTLAAGAGTLVQGCFRSLAECASSTPKVK